MTRKVKLQGFRELGQALGELKKATGRNVLRRTAVDALEPVAAAMKAKAPKDEGDLIDAIDVGTKRAKRAKKEFPGSSTVEAYAGVKVVGRGMPPQGVQQEFGNEHHGPQPFGRPAWDQEQDATLDRAKVALADQIEKAAARAARKVTRKGK